MRYAQAVSFQLSAFSIQHSALGSGIRLQAGLLTADGPYKIVAARKEHEG
jgi:hypothetical protein